MKKLFLFLILCSFVFSGAMAQSTFKTTGGVEWDTLTNAETAYLYTTDTRSSDKLIGIVAYADTLSGTDAVITVQRVVWISDVTGWAPIGSAVTLVDTTSAGAVAVAEASVSFTADHCYFKKQGLKFTSTGTQSAIIKGEILYRSPD